MQIRVDHHIHVESGVSDFMAHRIASQIQQLKEYIMATQSELKVSIDNIATHVAKVGAETQTLIDKIGELTAAIATAGNTTPEVDAAVAALEAQVAVVDALVPDA